MLSPSSQRSIPVSITLQYKGKTGPVRRRWHSTSEGSFSSFLHRSYSGNGWTTPWRVSHFDTLAVSSTFVLVKRKLFFFYFGLERLKTLRPEIDIEFGSHPSESSHLYPTWRVDSPFLFSEKNLSTAVRVFLLTSRCDFGLKGLFPSNQDVYAHWKGVLEEGPTQ